MTFSLLNYTKNQEIETIRGAWKAKTLFHTTITTALVKAAKTANHRLTYIGTVTPD